MTFKLIPISGFIALVAMAVQAQPINNNFADAVALSGTSIVTNGSTSQPANATKEPGEPNHAGLVGGRSVWFTWTAPVSGPTRISTQGSSFNTLLGVYTGTAVNALAEVASNDNAQGGGGNFSRVEFTAEQGTTYRIAVDGRNNSGNGTTSGNYVLTVQMLGSVILATPANGSVVFAGAPIPITAEVATPNPPVARVDFYRSGILLESITTPPFATVAHDAPLGTNRFSAVMTDGAGLSWTSTVANVAVLNLGVTILAPLDGAVFLNTNPITVSAVGLLPSGAVTNVEFFVNEVKIGEAAVTPFLATWNDVAPGVHRLTVVGSDDGGILHTSTPVFVAVARVLVPTNSVWSFLDNGSDQGTNWINPGFDESGWTNGPAQLGYGDGDEATIVSYGTDPNNKFVTTYFRRGFTVENAAGYTSLVLRVQRDDGAVAYLNGFEGARFNMPAGTIGYTTFAASTASDDGSTFLATTIPAGSLVEGTNLLAVEIHQSDLTSSDISFNLELLGIPAIPRNQPPLVSILSPTAGESFIAPPSITIEASASDADGLVAGVEFFADDAKIGETNDGPYRFVWENPPVGSHTLRVAAIDNEGGRTSSSQVTITVFDSGSTPLVQITWPTNGAVFQGPTNLVITAEASAANGVSNVLFLANLAVIGEDMVSPYSLQWNDTPTGVIIMHAVVFDNQGAIGTSATVMITVEAPPVNTNPPVIIAVNPPPGAAISNLTSVQVTFSERVTGVDAADLLVNGSPATGVSGSGSNFTFTVGSPAYGDVAITWVEGHGIEDRGLPPLPFDNTGPGATWNYNLLDLMPPVVASKNPPANATITNLTQLTVNFSEPVSGVDATDLLVNSVPATSVSGESTSFTFSFAQPPYGPVAISWSGEHGVADLALTPNPFDPAGPGATWSYTLDTRTALVQSNASYSFLKGTAEASTPMDAWRQPAFDDSSWSNSPAPFYYGDPYNNAANPGTLLSDMQNNYTSIYLRKHFTVPNLSAVTNLFLQAQSDDGFIAWINGVEVYRYNMPTGEIAFNAVTLTSINEPNGRGAPYIAYPLPDPAAYLVEGPNVLAIHAFNQSLTASSDFGFNAQLYTYLADASVAAPRIATTTPIQGEVFYLTNLIVTFTEPVSGVDASDLLVNGIPADSVASDTSTTYTFGFARPLFGHVTITWAADNGIADLDAPAKPFDGTSLSSILQFSLLNPSRPTVVGQTPLGGALITNLAEIIVTFNEPVVGVDASDLLVNGEPAAGVTGSDTSYTFALVQPPFGVVSVRWATNHGIADLETPANEFDPTRPGGIWNYTLVDPVPFVLLFNPTNNSAFTTPVNVTLQAFAADNDGVIALVEFFSGTNKLGEDTNSPFAFTWRNVPAGSYAVVAVATDNNGRTATSAPVNITVEQGATALVSSGAIWRYLDNGTDQSNAWSEVAFDDSTWGFGPSELGYGDTGDGRPEATVVSFGPDANNKFTTMYFRHAFVVTNTAEFTNLLLRVVRDDGAVAYLNGVEAARFNMPSSNINHLTLAASNVLGADEARFFVFPLDPARLVNGTNVLAVEIHQFAINSGSADISFDLELIANLPPVPPTVALTSPVNGALLLGPADILLRANAADSDGVVARVEFFEASGKLGETTNAPFTFVWINVALGGYSLFAVATDNSGLSATSSPVSITVTDSLPVLVVRGPYLQSGSPTGGVVRWRTDLPSDAVVFYGTDPANLTNLASQSMVTNEHIVQLSGLQADTKYYYSIGSSTRLLASGLDYWFVTSPVPGTQKPVRFWVLGDPGTANNNQRNVRDAYHNFAASTRPADIWLMLGDNAYQSGTDTEYQNGVFNIYPTTLRNLFLWPAVGNHETAQSYTATDFPYLHIFSLPQNGEAGGLASGSEKYYSFDYANIHFICLDSMTSTRNATSPMARWLQDDLASTAQEWVIVYFHHPPYTKGNHNSDAELDLIEVRQNILPILEAGGVDLVLCGHSHAWERSYLLHGHYGNSGTLVESMKLDGGDGREDGTGAYRKNEHGEGVVYTVAGSAGQITGGSLDHRANFISLNELGSMIIDVTSNRLDATFLATNGVSRDHFTLLKPLYSDRPPAPLNLIARATSLSEISLSWTDMATNETGFVVERSLDGTNFTQLTSVGADVTNTFDQGLLASTTYFYRVRAVNASGHSEFSNIASATTVIPTGTPRAPSDLVASSGNGVVVYRSQMILRWRDRSTDESGFQIERSLDGFSYVAVATVGENITHFTDRGLESGTAYYYRVRSFNALGQSPPSNLAGDITHPQSEIALAGTSVTFHAGAEGESPVRYQWRFLGASIFGETNQTLTLDNVQPGDEGAYSVAVTDATGRIVSNPAYLFVVTPPHIVVHPSDCTNTLGTTASFSVVAGGTGPFTYRWRKDGAVLEGEAGSTLTITDVQMVNQGAYDALVENEFGSITSRAALLTVNLPPLAGADTVYRFQEDNLAIEIADLLANDSDPDGDLIALAGVVTNSAQGGTVELVGRYVIYVPPDGYRGEDSFIYTLADSRGGFAPGPVKIEISDNTPPAMAPIPDFIASVAAGLVITNLAVDADVPANALTYALEPGAPSNARVHPESGVFLWTPARHHAPSTNLVTVKVSDNGIPSLSDRKSFKVVVMDYFEVTAGTAVLRAGDSGSVPLDFYSSAGLATFDCTLLVPEDRLTNLMVEALLPEAASVSMRSPKSGYVVLSVAAMPGQTLQGTQHLARLHFTSVPGQSSAFVPVQVRELACTRAGEGLMPTPLATDGRVVIVGGQSLLEGRFGAGGERQLILYGRPGVRYGLDSSTNVTDPAAWIPWQQTSLTNLFRILPVESNPPSIFFRARE